MSLFKRCTYASGREEPGERGAVGLTGVGNGNERPSITDPTQQHQSIICFPPTQFLPFVPHTRSFPKVFSTSPLEKKCHYRLKTHRKPISPVQSTSKSPTTPPRTPPASSTTVPASPSIGNLRPQLARKDPLGPDFEEPAVEETRSQRVRKYVQSLQSGAGRTSNRPSDPAVPKGIRVPAVTPPVVVSAVVRSAHGQKSNRGCRDVAEAEFDENLIGEHCPRTSGAVCFDASLWINTGKIYRDVPVEVSDAFQDATKIPRDLQATLPAPALPVTDFLDVKLPRILEDYDETLHDTNSWFSANAPNCDPLTA
ncbi:hypothetical protein B0H16DRAFT_1465373 [Mycena metata]|uniref:Uncharacterized protein n=1 Tax=Mycena metata TaxID=1033252 RepID=A0AAD7IDL0_9AGAR|nr:hypothetical protein B0H16DRAFT_1465373 [Mycena metata]